MPMKENPAYVEKKAEDDDTGAEGDEECDGPLAARNDHESRLRPRKRRKD